MNRLDQLPRIADELMADMHADAGLRQRILARATHTRTPRAWLLRAAPFFAALVLVASGTFVIARMTAPSNSLGPHKIDTYSSGETTSAPPMLAMLDVPEGSLMVSGAQEPSKFRSIFAKGDGGNFPMIGYEGKAYRMLTSPGSVGGRALGDSLGTIATFADEPALADSDAWYGLLSNAASEGTEVYAISGLNSDTAIAAEVNGKTRMFQRVSFADYGTNGGTLEDALSIRNKAVALDLSGVGQITDADTASSLVDILLDSASYYSEDSLRGKQSLTITLKNGLAVQLLVSDELVSACGTWSCSDFFDAFRQAL